MYRICFYLKKKSIKNRCILFDDVGCDSLLRKFVIVQNIFRRKPLHNISKVENWKYIFRKFTLNNAFTLIFRSS